MCSQMVPAGSGRDGMGDAVFFETSAEPFSDKSSFQNGFVKFYLSLGNDVFTSWL